MLAAVLRNTGDNDLEVTDTIQVNDPGPDDVIVKITHTGCLPLRRFSNEWNNTSARPSSTRA